MTMIIKLSGISHIFYPGMYHCMVQFSFPAHVTTWWLPSWRKFPFCRTRRSITTIKLHYSQFNRRSSPSYDKRFWWYMSHIQDFFWCMELISVKQRIRDKHKISISQLKSPSISKIRKTVGWSNEATIIVTEGNRDIMSTIQDYQALGPYNIDI